MSNKTEKLNGIGYLSRNYRYSLFGISYQYYYSIVDKRNGVLKSKGMISTFTISMAQDIILKIIERLEKGW